MANIAFKVRYCNGSVENGHVGFQGICTDGLIRYYIFDMKQFPCSDSNCICYNYWRYSSKELESYFNISAPCYESNILRDWRIKAKTNISIPEELVNGLCVLTTSRPNLPDRLVFAIFLIKDVVANEIFADDNYRLEFYPTEFHRANFWSVHKSSDHKWNKRAFKYFDDTEAVQFLKMAIDLKRSSEEEGLANNFLDHYCQINNINYK